MKNLKEKLRLIFIPCLILSLSFIAVYTFLHWLLIIQLKSISLKEDIINFWLPFGLSSIVVFIWLRPRIKLLAFKRDNASFGFQFVAAIIMLVPTIVAQHYIDTATGKLTRLKYISDYPKLEETKYYVIEKYLVDKGHPSFQSTATSSGRYNHTLNYHIYTVVPLVTNSWDTLSLESRYWIGEKNSTSINNSASEAEKDKKFSTLAEETQSEFNKKDFNSFQYLERVGNSEDHDEFIRAIEKSELNPSDTPVIFKAHQTPFARRNGQSLVWIFLSLAIGASIFFVMLLFPKFKPGSLDRFTKGIKEKDSDLDQFLPLLIPGTRFFVTPIIMYLNVFVYLIMVLTGLGVVAFKGIDLVKWGANYRPLTLNGDWWRLLTSTFLHGGLMHILSNMIALVFAGIILEPLLGRFRYAITYLLCGLVASCASIWWYEATVSVGASGAIFGLYGTLLGCFLLKVFPSQSSKGLLLSMALFVGYNLLMGLIGGIDNAAHIGGLVTGFLLSFLIVSRSKIKTSLASN